MPSLKIVFAILLSALSVGLGYIVMAKSDVKKIGTPWLHSLIECASINPDTEILSEGIVARTGCKANIDGLGIEVSEAIAALDSAGDRGEESTLSWAIPFYHQGISYTAYCAIMDSSSGEAESISCMSVQNVRS